MIQHQKIVETIFASQGSNGCWKILEESNRNYPACLHYSPTFKSTLWTLILLADLEHDPDDERIKVPLSTIQEHFYDPVYGIYSLERSFPYSLSERQHDLSGCYFNRSLSEKRLLKQENVRSENILPALQLLKSKQQSERNWNLEKKISNMVASVGAENKPNEISRLWMKTKGIH